MELMNPVHRLWTVGVADTAAAPAREAIRRLAGIMLARGEGRGVSKERRQDRDRHLLSHLAALKEDKEK